MRRDLFARLRSRPGEDDGQADDRRFVPSLLDRSVLFAHGSGRDDVTRKLQDVQAEARELEEHQRM